MNEETPLSDERLEAMVKARLEERAREIDPQPLLDRLQDRLSNSAAAEELSGAAAVQPAASDSVTRTRRTTKDSPARWRRWSLAVAAAASLALAVLGAIYVWPTPATAATLVLAAKQERLRTWASGRCLDADQPGIYRREAPTTGSRRKVVRGASNN